MPHGFNSSGERYTVSISIKKISICQIMIDDTERNKVDEEEREYWREKKSNSNIIKMLREGFSEETCVQTSIKREN